MVLVVVGSNPTIPTTRINELRKNAFLKNYWVHLNQSDVVLNQEAGLANAY